MIDVSVVVPTHNRRGLLETALAGALAQAGVTVEVVVVDDGSTDDTGELLASTSGLRVIRHVRPLGVAASRNAGCRVARGRWVALLDDDDAWAPWKLAEQVAAARAAQSPWAYGGAVEVSADGQVQGAVRAPEPASLVAALPRRNVVPAGSSNVLVSRELLERLGGFDERLRHVADWDMWLRLARCGLPAAVREPLVAYRQHGGQATLDTAGMAAEARVLRARHGVHPAVVHRWAAWSHLREGRRGPAVRACLAAAAAGDLTSLGRAVVAGVVPDPVALHRRLAPTTPDDDRLVAEAQGWVDRAWARRLPTSTLTADRR